MRQSGVIAAAALYALDHNWDRLAEDHDNAHQLAAGIANIKGLDCEVDKHADQPGVLRDQEARHDGRPVRRGLQGARRRAGRQRRQPTRIRAVTHLDVNRADIDAALKVINDVMAA